MQVRLEKVSFSYAKKGKDVLHECSFVFESGRFYAILGPSGIGKTTLLRLIAGLEDYSGHIYLDERAAEGIPVKDRGLAYLTQTYALYPRKTLFENIAYPLRLQDVPVDEIKRRVYEIAEPFGLLDALSRRPAQVSGGQQQKTALARALVKRPSLGLFDEPFSNLDVSSRDSIRPILKQVANDFGMTVLYVTHDVKEALALADEVLLLDEKGLRSLGDPLAIAQSSDPKIMAFLEGMD